MQLYNTLNRRLEPFAPTGPHVGIYVCGVTPYDTTHLGHARCYVVFDLLQRKDLVERVTEDGEIEAAKDTPPQTTRAKLRGDFIAAAQQAGRDFTVDWVHLKLNDQAQRTVLCKDPFRAVDERVERLIASL